MEGNREGETETETFVIGFAGLTLALSVRWLPPRKAVLEADPTPASSTRPSKTCLPLTFPSAPKPSLQHLPWLQTDTCWRESSAQGHHAATIHQAAGMPSSAQPWPISTLAPILPHAPKLALINTQSTQRQPCRNGQRWYIRAQSLRSLICQWGRGQSPPGQSFSIHLFSGSRVRA